MLPSSGEAIAFAALCWQLRLLLCFACEPIFPEHVSASVLVQQKLILRLVETAAVIASASWLVCFNVIFVSLCSGDGKKCKCMPVEWYFMFALLDTYLCLILKWSKDWTPLCRFLWHMVLAVLYNDHLAFSFFSVSSRHWVLEQNRWLRNFWTLLGATWSYGEVFLWFVPVLCFQSYTSF